MSTYETNRVLVDRYLRGKDILLKPPGLRTDEDFGFLRKWMPENVQLFQKIDSGKEHSYSIAS